MPAATQFFEETFRPAKLLIEVYRLLDNDGIQTEHDWIKQLRPLVGAGADEELMLLWNGVFLGLVMEAASVRKSSLRRDVLKPRPQNSWVNCDSAGRLEALFCDS